MANQPGVAAGGRARRDHARLGAGGARGGHAARGRRRAGGAAGDLRVRFNVAFPPRLSPLQLAQLQAVLG